MRTLGDDFTMIKIRISFRAPYVPQVAVKNSSRASSPSYHNCFRIPESLLPRRKKTEMGQPCVILLGLILVLGASVDIRPA